MNCSGFVSTSDQSLYNHTIIHLRTRSICAFISYQLHGHFNGVEPTRLTKQIVEFYDKRSKTKMKLMKWMIPAIKEDLDASGIPQSVLHYSKIYHMFNVFSLQSVSFNLTHKQK